MPWSSTAARPCRSPTIISNHITHMNSSFENKVALVTGAGSGMGLTTARAFAEAGAAVALADVNDTAVRSAAKELVAAGHKAIGIRCNVADEAEVAAMIAQTVSTFARLDAAFNNAGIQSPAMEMADVSGEEFERVNGINLRGVWNCMKYELRQMREQGSGTIVNNSSIGGLIGIPGRAAYHASKHGVIGLTKSAALEYASRGIFERGALSQSDHSVLGCMVGCSAWDADQTANRRVVDDGAASLLAHLA